MLTELLANLTTEQREALEERGIKGPRQSEFRSGKRLPTEVQVAAIAEVTGAEWVELQREVTLRRAPPSMRKSIARVIGATLRNP